MFNILKQLKDFACVKTQPENSAVAGIEIPVIPLEKYPEIIQRVAGLAEKLAQAVSEKEGKPVEAILSNMGIADLLQHIPTLVRVAADEFFEFAAFILNTDEMKVRKLGLVDLIRIIRRVYDINELAEVQDEIRNFMIALKTVKPSRGKK